MMMNRYVIDRRTWLRGIGPAASLLLNDQGCRCCFGQILGQCGIKDDKILGVPLVANMLRVLNPDDIEKIKHLLTSSQYVEKAWVSRAYEINDNDNVNIDDAERERDLTALAAANGVELTFIN